jgi:hypothetical protein
MSSLHVIRSHYLDCASRAIEHAEICANRAFAQHRHPDCPPLSEYAVAAIEKDADRLERMAADLRAMADDVEAVAARRMPVLVEAA